jgi:DNA-binding NarL/FixJ family response regulator
VRILRKEDNMHEVKVLIVDKDGFFRSGIHQALVRESDFDIIESAPDENLMTVIEQELPNVILLDIDYPLLKGLELGKRLARRFLRSALVILSSNHNDGGLVEAIKSGAVAYLNKVNLTAEEVITTIERICQGEYPIGDVFASAPRAAQSVLEQFREITLLGKNAHCLERRLSLREMQVLNAIAEGRTNKEIGMTLLITEQTVKSHVSSILRKLEASSRAHALFLAMRNGWITPGEELWPRKQLARAAHHEVLSR